MESDDISEELLGYLTDTNFWWKSFGNLLQSKRGWGDHNSWTEWNWCPYTTSSPKPGHHSCPSSSRETESVSSYCCDTSAEKKVRGVLLCCRQWSSQKEEKAGLFRSSHEPRARYPTVSRHRVHKKRVSRFSGFIKRQSTLFGPGTVFTWEEASWLELYSLSFTESNSSGRKLLLSRHSRPTAVQSWTQWLCWNTHRVADKNCSERLWFVSQVEKVYLARRS